MSDATFKDIPWRKSELEILYDFLVSARDRCLHSIQASANRRKGEALCKPLLFGNPREHKLPRYLNTPNTPSNMGNRQPMTLNELDNPGSTSGSTAPTPTDDAYPNTTQMVANICILRGQTGCGKVTAVRRICEDIGLKIIEYDPLEVEMVNCVYGERYEGMTTSFMRFLDNTRRKPGLRMRSTVAGRCANRHNQMSHSLSPILLKRFKPMKRDMEEARTVNDIPLNEPHIILLKDLPRGILTPNNVDNVKRIQEIMENILEGDESWDIAAFPLLICVNNSESDRLMLKSILPNNYENHARCLRLNVSQITKSKMKVLLSKLLHTLGRQRTSLNEHLVDAISAMSFGDIRYGMANLHFYSTPSSHISPPPLSDLDILKNHMMERNTSSGVFNLLGKVLVNKRIPAILGGTPEDESATLLCNTNSGESLDVSRFSECFSLSKPVSRCSFDSQGLGSCMYPDYSDVLEILPKLSDDLVEMDYTYCEYEQPSQESDLEEALTNASCIRDYGMLQQESFNSLLSVTPLSVRLFGLKEPFNKAFPLSMSQWPTIAYDMSATPTKYPRSAMIPRLTRPGMYYVPEEMLDNGYVEGSFLVNCCFENYVNYFESVEDCAVFGTHLSFADACLNGIRYSSGQTDELLEQLHKTFSSICLRSTSDSNLGGLEGSGNKVFRHFGRNVWHSESRYDMERLQELYDFHLKELAARRHRQGDSRNASGTYICKQRAFVEIVPFMYMLISQEYGLDAPTRGIHLDTSMGISNIMTESLMEKVDLLIDESEESSKDSLEAKAVVKAQCGVLDLVTPIFKELLTEIGKHY